MATPTQTFDLGPSSEPIQVSKVALAIIIVFGVISLVGLVVALWVLIRFTCSRRGREVGHAIRDGRNEHSQWWKHANPPAVEMSHIGIIPAPESFAEDGKRRSRYQGEMTA
jgi:hypothetical protein